MAIFQRVCMVLCPEFKKKFLSVKNLLCPGLIMYIRVAYHFNKRALTVTERKPPPYI